MSMEDSKTRNREVRAILEASNQLDCEKLTIITLNESQTMENNGNTIRVVPVIDWIRKEYRAD